MVCITRTALFGQMGVKTKDDDDVTMTHGDIGIGGLAELGLMVTVVVVPLVNLRLALETK